MAAVVMRHFVIIGTSNNTVIRWQRMKIWGHRRQVWKRPQSKHKTSLLIPGACYPHPSHISFLNCSLLFTSIYHSWCEQGFLFIFYGETWPQTLAPPWHASARQSPVALAINSVVAHTGWQGTVVLTHSWVVWRARRLAPEHSLCFPGAPRALSSAVRYSKSPSKACWRWLLPSRCLNSQT